MKSDSVVRIYAFILLFIFGGIVLHAPFIVGMGTIFPSYDLAIKSWKEVLMVAAAILALWLVWQRGTWRELLRDRVMQVAVLYGALHALTALALRSDPLATIVGLAIDVRYVLFFALVYTLIKMAPAYKKYFLNVGVIGAAVVVGFGVLQLFLPIDVLSHIGYGENTIQPYLTVDQNPDYIRINSTLRGPNPLGAYIVIVLGLLLAAVLRGKFALDQSKKVFVVGLASLSSLAVLWASYSRSAAGAAGVTLFLVAAIAARHRISRKLWIAGCAALLALAGGAVMMRDHSFVTNVILHENNEGGSPISSNSEHMESLKDGTARLLRQPIGAGIGSTGSASLLTDEPLIIENQYLFIAHEVGWLGLGVFIVLFCLVLSRLWRGREDWLHLGLFASGVGLALIGILLPVWVDDTVSIIWWGLAAAIIASKGEKNVRRTTK